MTNLIADKPKDLGRAGTPGSMRLVVLGATGGTGLEIVRQAIEHGHSVTTLVRSPQRLKPFLDRITVNHGDLLNSADLARIIEGHDAVLSGFGPRVPVSKADAHLLEQFGVALTRAMSQAGVKRVVVESVAFLFKNSIFPPAYLLGRLFFQERLPMHQLWNGFSRKANSTGRWCVRLNSRTNPTPANIASERDSYRSLASKSHVRM